MKERLQQLLKHERLTPVKFAERVGVQRSSVSHILSGRNNPGLEFIQKILTNFPKVSSDWLISGQGDMYRTSPKDVSKVIAPDKSVNRESEKHLFSTEEDEPATYFTKSPQPAAELPNKAPEELLAAATLGTLAIERIIIFYVDGSFREYHTQRK